MTEELFKMIHQLHGEMLGQREIARRVGVSRNTVKKVLASEVMPRCKRKVRGSKIDPHRGFLMAKLQQYPELSAVRLAAMLKEQGHQIGITLVKDAVADIRPRLKKVYRELVFAPGECAQVDWGVWEQMPVLNGTRRLSVFTIVLCDSRLMYAELFPSEKQEFWHTGFRNAFAFFGGMPARVMVDNCKTAVLTPASCGRPPVLNPQFEAFARAYGFGVSPCTPGSPEEKGRIENGVKYVKGSFLAGREPTSLEILNPLLRDWYQNTANRRLHGTTGERPEEAFNAREKAILKPLPSVPPSCATVDGAVANSCCRVKVDCNRYSIPPQFGSRRVIVHRHADRIAIYTKEGQMIADHPRCFGYKQSINAPAHVLAAEAIGRDARENREVTAFLGLGSTAAAYLSGLREKRLDHRAHVRRIIELSRIHGIDTVSRALQDAQESQAYSADYILNLITARQRLAPAKSSTLHVSRNADLLDLRTPQVDLTKYDTNERPRP